mmetsp:Transcript_14682/g.25996  ORF Transcript_14682/g.25996 Transcript_14682/m.25996 type:complete len:252 (-) Transcript_14682:44-799(-)
MDREISQYVMVEDPLQCAALAAEASEVEKKAMQDDREGCFAEAAEGYRQVAAKLQEAVDICPEGHPDKQVLSRHVDQVLERADYLDNLDGAAATTPLEEHIQGVQLTLGIPSAMQDIQWLTPSATWKIAPQTKVMGAAGLISGAAGLLILGPLGGAVIGVATAHATTREDWTGSASRMVGQVGVKLVDQAKTLEKEHKIRQRVVAVSQTATDKAQTAISKFNERHKVTEKATRGISSAWSVLSNVVCKATG